MRMSLTTVAVGIALSVPASAQMGNITGNEYAGEPINSSVRSSAKNPQTGLTPGGEAAYGRAYVKRLKHQRAGTTRVYVVPSRRY